MTESRIQRAVREAFEADDPRRPLLALGSEVELHAPEDAAAVARFVVARRDSLRDLHDRAPLSLLAVVADLFQEVRTREAFEVLAEQGLPVLRDIFDALIGRPLGGGEGEDVLFLAKIFALYRDEADLPRIVRAASHPVLREGFLWTGIFGVFDEDHPSRQDLLEEFRADPPEGFAGVAYLDYANALAREEGVRHPFDTPSGVERLERFLVDPDPERFSYAHSAAAALPFVSEPARGPLFALAFDHPSERVQLEAGWASAKLGSRAGIDFLSRLCLDVRHSSLAVEYLRELGELNAIPARAMNPDFTAMAAMCRWLAHPMEFGRPPDEAEVYDTRTLVWPPANEERRLHLIKYRYRNAKADGNDDIGVGMVGSITFALFGETAPEMPPEEIYALHCCWELETENDPRAPVKRSVEAGKEVLRGAGNSGF